MDRFGPLAVIDLLFGAYRAAALTQEIDPFLVDLRGPADVRGGEMLDAMKHPDFLNRSFKGYQFRITEDAAGKRVLYQVDREWVYHREKRCKPTLIVNRDWRRCNENVAKLAA